MIFFTNHYRHKLFAATVLLVLPAIAAVFHVLPAAGAAGAEQSRGQINEQRLVGRWVRPDGGYLLELKEIAKDGAVKAAYFNPRPINVSRAELRHGEEGVGVFIELRDVNYPGSTYNLRYDPEADRLIGTYFQAVHGETYRIEFMRAK